MSCWPQFCAGTGDDVGDAVDGLRTLVVVGRAQQAPGVRRTGRRVAPRAAGLPRFCPTGAASPAGRGRSRPAHGPDDRPGAGQGPRRLRHRVAGRWAALADHPWYDVGPCRPAQPHPAVGRRRGPRGRVRVDAGCRPGRRRAHRSRDPVGPSARGRGDLGDARRVLTARWAHPRGLEADRCARECCGQARCLHRTARFRVVPNRRWGT